jgi:manganese-dependent inorganic pyrophosphatase
MIMNMKIYVIGHKSPDLDSVSAAVVYAEFLNKIQRYGSTQVVALRAGEPNKETSFIFEKAGAQLPPHIEDISVEETDSFILVDHNEESQRHELVNNDKIVEIVDHHKLNVNFTSPIKVDIKPLGSTGSIVYEYFKQYGATPSQRALTLILSAILSDTVGLKGPTTTDTDSQIVREIADSLDVKLEEFILELFRAKSDLNGLSAKEITTKDFKVFDFGGKKVFIGQVETAEPDKVLGNKAELLGALTQVKSEQGTDMAYLFVTDILNLYSQAIYTSDEEEKVLAKAFMGEGSENLMNVGPKVSRKKDFAPAIEKALEEL